MHLQAYIVKSKNAQKKAQRKACMSLKSESGTLMQYLAVSYRFNWGLNILYRRKIERSAGDRQRPDTQYSLESWLLEFVFLYFLY